MEDSEGRGRQEERGRERGRVEEGEVEQDGGRVVVLLLQLRWLDRCVTAHKRPESQNLFGIVQGGLQPELRRKCVAGEPRKKRNASSLPFSFPLSFYSSFPSSLSPSFPPSLLLEMVKRDLPGYAIGGLSGGEEKDVFWRIVSLCTDLLPRGKPIYLMGVG